MVGWWATYVPIQESGFALMPTVYFFDYVAAVPRLDCVCVAPRDNLFQTIKYDQFKPSDNINIGLGLFVHAVDGLSSECGSVH
jgi:hypothetical protein